MAQIVAIPGQPGERIDKRILPDVEALIRKFKVRVTDGFATSGHAPGGEHPLGLAVDLVPDPSRGGTWDDVDRLVSWARTQPQTFRWIGYDGEPGHGRGNHAHLSWAHDSAGKPGALASLGIAGQAARGLLGGVRPAPDVVADIPKAITGGAQAAAEATAKVIFRYVADALGENGARMALTVGLVAGGALLAATGVARATGTSLGGIASGAALAAATKNPKAALGGIK